MKNLESARLKPYRVEPPAATAKGFGAFFPASKVYAFEFPEKDTILKSIVSVIHFMGMESTRISMSVMIPYKQVLWTVRESDIYKLQEYLQRPGESFVWQYSHQLHQMRVESMKAAKGVEFDWLGSPLQVVQSVGETPPFKQAYEAEINQKGTVGKWQFIHLKIDAEFPWETLQNVSDKVFRNNLVQVFFNEETKKHPGEFVVWYNPSAMPLI